MASTWGSRRCFSRRSDGDGKHKWRAGHRPALGSGKGRRRRRRGGQPLPQRYPLLHDEARGNVGLAERGRGRGDLQQLEYGVHRGCNTHTHTHALPLSLTHTHACTPTHAHTLILFVTHWHTSGHAGHGNMCGEQTSHVRWLVRVWQGMQSLRRGVWWRTVTRPPS